MQHRFPSYWLTIVLLLLAAVAMAVQGTWNIDLAHHWAFIAIMMLMFIAAGWQAYRHDNCAYGMLSHGGLALLLLAVMAGKPWNENGQAIVSYNEPVRLAYTADGQPLALPFELQLKDFQITYYEDNEHIQQFTSTLFVKGLTQKDTTTQVLTTSVNHPARYHGYRLYQDSYDVNHQQYSVIKIVKEPLLPLVYIAFALLAIGAILGIRDHWSSQKKWLILVAILLAILFTILSVLRIRFGHLMPALRSYWFIPHLACYMLAYSLLAIALVLTTIHHTPYTIHLISTASALLILGMLCGAVWAKQAWGDYWTWDPKECWAAATWLLSLVAIHSASEKKAHQVIKITAMLLCFLAMQVTWYGVNYLPSAKESLHTYNSK